MSLSDFVFLSKIGEGSFSSVHKVNRTSDGKVYALKQVITYSQSGKNKYRKAGRCFSYQPTAFPKANRNPRCFNTGVTRFRYRHHRRLPGHGHPAIVASPR